MHNTISNRLLAVMVATAIAAPAVFAGGKCGATADECLLAMHDSISQRGWLGIEYEDHDGEDLPEIIGVLEGGAGERDGIQVGDVLLSLNGVPFAGSREAIYREYQKSLKPGNELRFVVRRGDSEVEVAVTACKVPDDIAAQWVGRHMLEYHLDDEDVEPVDDSPSDDTEGVDAG